MKKVEVSYVDDLDGSVATQVDVNLQLDNRAYQLDLSSENYARLEEALRPFLEVARRATSGSGSAAPRAVTSGAGGAKKTRRSGAKQREREHNAAIRRWGREHGYDVPERGRIPKQIQDAYEFAQRVA